MRHSTLNSAEVQGIGTRNAAQLWPGASNMAICRSSWECERKDRFENRAKNQTAVFKSSTVLLPKGREKRRYKVDLKHLAVARNCVYGRHSIHSSWFFSGRCINNQRVCIYSYSLAEKLPQTRSLHSDSKEKLATKNCGLCFAANKKFYWHFLVTTFFHVATEKKFQSPVGTCLKMLISEPENPANILTHQIQTWIHHQNCELMPNKPSLV